MYLTREEKKISAFDETATYTLKTNLFPVDEGHAYSNGTVLYEKYMFLH